MDYDVYKYQATRADVLGGIFDPNFSMRKWTSAGTQRCCELLECDPPQPAVLSLTRTTIPDFLEKKSCIKP